MKYLLGIDIGTSGTKTVLFDTAGTAVASYTAEYPLYQPRNGWAEQDAADWWKAVITSVSAVVSGVDATEIGGVGLSGQMHGLVMLDSQDRLLRRSIIWCDQRTAEQCATITADIGAKRIIEITGNPVLTGFTASKIRWVAENEPEVFEKATKIMLPKDYIRYMLTGEFATEVSDAGGMQLLDIARRDWSAEVCGKLGVGLDKLPKVYESYQISGRVSASAAALTGLPVGTPVVGGAGDQAAGAVGNGIVRPGAVSCSLGSSGVVFASTDSPVYDPLGRVHTFCHAVPNTWHVMGVSQASGLSLKWFRDNFCADICKTAELLRVDPYVLMDKAADTAPVGADGIIFLPYLMGERTPHLDADCRGVFFGLSAMHTRADMIRAVMEGVAFSQTDSLDIIRSLGAKPEFVRVFGGGGRSPLWRRILADCLDTQVRTPSSAEGPALGVALLAGVGTGVYSSVQQACDAVIRDTSSLMPDPAFTSRYMKILALYRKLYTSLKDDFKALAALQ